MAEEKNVEEQEVTDVQETEQEQEKEFELEIEDDTPEKDRGREPMPKEVVKELEDDELTDYSEKVKTRMIQMKKVWHDERREKERALREQQEAISLAQKVVEENKKLKAQLSSGEMTYIDTAKNAASLELEMAKRAYREAHDIGDSDKIVEAQEKLSNASYKVQKLNEYKPTLQFTENNVNIEPTEQAEVPRPDQKTLAWQERNTWFGRDEEMTSLALGLHQRLEKQYGPQYVGTDEYWDTVDKTMKKRFPEYFGNDEDEAAEAKPQRTDKPATVVAPASRSTAPKKIVLKQSQLAIARKLGLTPEQYAREYAKTMGA